MREKTTSTVFVAVLVAFFIVVMLCPRDEKASVLENRALAEHPILTWTTYFDRSFESAYEVYLTDNVGYRSGWVNLGNKIENARGLQKEEWGKIVRLSDGKELVLNDGKIQEVYKKHDGAREFYIRVLNKYGRKFKDTNMYLMIVPTQIEFDQSKYHDVSYSQKEEIDKIYSSVRGYKTVNVYDKLKEKTDEYIYFRTDHHWTQLGAYYGYEAFAEEKGVEPIPIESFERRTFNGFLGYLYNQANDKTYKKYADDVEYFSLGKNYNIPARGLNNYGAIENYSTMLYCPPAEGTNPNYDIFLGGNHGFLEIDTGIENGETALIIKDSYGNTVIPFFVNHYERIFVVDPRMFGGNIEDLITFSNVDDVIFINYTFTTTFDDFIRRMDKVMK